MSVYSITHASEQALRLLLKAGGGEETLLLQRAATTLLAHAQLEPCGAKLVATLRIADRTETMVLQSDDPANANQIADYLEALANGTAETAKPASYSQTLALAPCRICSGEALAVDYMGEHDVWLNRVFCRYNNCHEVDGYESLQAAKLRWNELQAEQPPAQPAARPDMVNHPPHYNEHPSGIECIRVTERLPFNLGNAFKYVFRHKAKNGREDLQKAHWYLKRELERDHRPGIAVYDLQEANGLARAIAAHEPYPAGAALVAIANDEPAEALSWVERLLAA